LDISGAFFSKRCDIGEDVHNGYTSNVLIRTSILQETGVRFDESLNLVGGEDVLFFHALRMRGYSGVFVRRRPLFVSAFPQVGRRFHGCCGVG